MPRCLFCIWFDLVLRWVYSDPCSIEIYRDALSTFAVFRFLRDCYMRRMKKRWCSPVKLSQCRKLNPLRSDRFSIKSGKIDSVRHIWQQCFVIRCLFCRGRFSQCDENDRWRPLRISAASPRYGFADALVICNSLPTLRGQQFVTGTRMFKKYINSAVDWPVVEEQHFSSSKTFAPLPRCETRMVIGVRRYQWRK